MPNEMITRPLTAQGNMSLKFLEMSGLIPVRVDYGHKRPPGDFNPKMIEGADHSITMSDLASGRYNFGALFSGKFVDVDIDNTNPALLSALDHFLPPTNYVWGRPTKPRSHRAYALFEDFCRERYSSILRYIKALEPGVAGEDSFSLEIRGGAATSGMFTVLPGSWREDAKEEVAWADGVDLSSSPSYVEVNHLLKAVRLSVAASVISPWWLAGTRNDLSLALAGLLYRIRASTLAANSTVSEEDLPDHVMILSEKDALDLMDAVMDLAGDTHGDEFTRKQNLKNTWRKMEAESGAKATGGAAMAKLIGEEYGQKVVKALYKLLSDNPAADEIEAAMDQFVIWYGPGVLIDLEMVRAGHDKPWMLKTQAEVSMAGEKIQIGAKKVSKTALLFGTKLVQRVRGMTFDPGTKEIIVDTEGGKKVNRWSGFRVAPFPTAVTNDAVRPFLQYVKEVLADNDSGAYDWVLDWLADIMQHPSKKPGTALVLVGEQGAGKSYLGECIMRQIIGETHSTSANDINALVSQFNKLAENRLFLQVDESTSSGSRAAADKLKSIISDNSIQIEPKGIDRYAAPNHMRILFTSNRENTAVFIDGSRYERRYTVLHVNPKRATDVVWWEGFREWTQSHLPEITRFLCDRVYDKKTIRRPYETRAKRVIQMNGLDPEVAYILERIDAGFPISEDSHEHWFDAFNDGCIKEKDKNSDKIMRGDWPTWVRVGALEEDFRRWVRGRGHAMYGRSTMKLAEFLDVQRVSQLRVSYYDEKSKKHVEARPRFYEIPSKEAILLGLKGRYGDIIDDIQISVRNMSPADDMPDTSDEGEY